MVTIYSALVNPRPSKPSKFPNRRFRNNFVEVVGVDGKKRLEVNGTYDAYEQTQECKEMVDIYHLIDRAMMRDYSGLRARPAVYADLVGLPESMPQLFADMEKARRVFEGLDVSTRAYYHNSFDSFLAMYDGGELRSVESSQPAPPPPTEPTPLSEPKGDNA